MLSFARFLPAPTLIGLATLQACGPSVSTIYEGNIRFEHCYRLDLDPHIAPTHRRACWDEWSRRYTYGQTRDRLEYARRRVSEVESGNPTPLELDLSRADGGAPEADASPPVDALPAPSGSTPAPRPDSRRPAPPHEDCALECRQSWRTCRDECDPEAKRGRSSCKACDKDYGRCVQRCFK